MLFVIGVEPTTVVPHVVREEPQVVPHQTLDNARSPTQCETDPATTLEQQMKERPSKITDISSIPAIVSVTGIICTCSFHLSPVWYRLLL